MSMGASRCNFPAERYVLRMYDGFRAWNFRRSPFRARKIAATCATRSPYTALVGLQLLPDTPSVGCNDEGGLG